MASKKEEIFNCVLSGDLSLMKQLLEGEDATDGSPEQELFSKVDENGRNALLTASMLGKSSMVRELVRHGARVNEPTVRGYSSLHLAACWGHLDTVKTLLELGGDTHSRTFRGERPVDLARRHAHADCTDCLTLAETKEEDAVADSQKNLTQEEKPFKLTKTSQLQTSNPRRRR